jgi:hypothetical protein
MGSGTGVGTRTAAVSTSAGTISRLPSAPEPFSIPTEAELSERLTGLERLITAKRWERAAIVYAFTTNVRRRTDLHPEVGFPVTMGRFAQLGFTGLTSKDTVARYRAAWQLAIDEGHASPTVPGQTDVALPELDYPGYPDKVDGMTVTRLSRAIQSDPEAAQVARTLLDQMDAEVRPPSPLKQNYSADFDRALKGLMTSLIEMGMIWPYLSEEDQQSGSLRKTIRSSQHRINEFVARTGYGELRSVRRQNAS